MKVRTATTAFVALYILSFTFQNAYIYLLISHGPKLLCDQALGSMHFVYHDSGDLNKHKRTGGEISEDAENCQLLRSYPLTANPRRRTAIFRESSNPALLL